MKNNKFVFIPSFSLQPNKLVSFNSVFIRDYENERLISVHDQVKTKAIKFKNINTDNKITRSSHNYKISDNAYRTLKKRINWLYYLAKSKRIKTYNGKDIFNFKIGFITLTLPSKQLTPTKDVTNNLLNNFLTEIRQRTKMRNYVWRLEFQENGNAHYHIVTDTYIDYFLIRKIWNRLLKLNGYIAPYQEKMNKLTLKDYNSKYNKKNKRDYSEVVKTYARSKKDNWENPPSVNVRSVISNRAISNYISKYFGKNEDKSNIGNELDNEDNSSNLRLWYCSRSLSKLKTIVSFCDEVDYDIFSIVSYCKDVKKLIHRYCTVILFDIKVMIGNARKWIEMILKNYSKQQGYIPAK